MGHIVALGGGGFSEDAVVPLDTYIISLPARSNPRVCFIPTASGDADGYIDKFYAAFSKLPCKPAHLSLFRRTESDLHEFLLQQDVLYVGGGNTANLLAVWRMHGLVDIVREAWKRGTVLAGLSAGAVCWFEAGITDSFGPPLRELTGGLGFLPGLFCPHLDSEPEREHAFVKIAGVSSYRPAYAADDGVGFHFVGSTLEAVVADSPGKRAIRLRSSANEAGPERLPTVILPHDDSMPG